MCVAALVLGCCAVVLRADPTAVVWTAPAMTRVQPQTAPGDSREAVISAARNEYEPFQVVVTAVGGDLKSCTAAVTPLTAPPGRGAAVGGVIPASCLKLYREHYVKVTTPSYACDTPPGEWPDALIPLQNPYGEQTAADALYIGQPFDVPEGRNQPLWIEVRVPQDAAPGDYAGEVVVQAAGEHRIPVRLHVWGFAIPAHPTMRGDFGGFHSAAAAWGMGYADEGFRRIEQRFIESALEHRIMPAAPGWALPVRHADGSIDPSGSHEKLRHLVEDLGMNSIRVPCPTEWAAAPEGSEERAKCVRYLQAMQAYLDEHGWGDMAYVYALDEPNDEEAYEQVRKIAAGIHAAGTRIKVMVTEQTLTSDPAWGDLYGAVDIWCPLWGLYHDPTARERLAKGEEIWVYTALCQGKRNPWWQIDFPLLEYRIPMWMAFHHGVTGVLYWATTYWSNVGHNPWSNPLTIYGRYNGEGSLFYPGKQAGIDGPISSMRLKAIREGMEDYEYLVLQRRWAAEIGDSRTLGEEIARALAPSWFEWDPDPAHLYAGRDRLGGWLEVAAMMPRHTP